MVSTWLLICEDLIANHSLYPTSASDENTLSMCSIKKIDAIIITEIQKTRFNCQPTSGKRVASV